MAEPWFFAAPPDWAEGSIALPAEESHHARRVLRLGAGDAVVVIDGVGGLARGRLAVAGEGLSVVPESIERWSRPRPEVVVYQAAAKGRKVDETIERLAEIGAAEVWVYPGKRSVVAWDGGKIARLEERWSSLARAAAKLARTPWATVTGALSRAGMLQAVGREPAALALWEEAEQPLRTALPGEPDRIALIVGPEGGLTGSEIDELRRAGADAVSLGDRILRTETAALVAAGALLWDYGVIG